MASASERTPSQRSSMLKFSPPRMMCRWLSIRPGSTRAALEIDDPRRRARPSGTISCSRPTWVKRPSLIATALAVGLARSSVVNRPAMQDEVGGRIGGHQDSPGSKCPWAGVRTRAAGSDGSRPPPPGFSSGRDGRGVESARRSGCRAVPPERPPGRRRSDMQQAVERADHKADGERYKGKLHRLFSRLEVLHLANAADQPTASG